LIKTSFVSMLPNTPYHRNPQAFSQLIAFIIKANAGKLFKMFNLLIMIHRANPKPPITHISNYD